MLVSGLAVGAGAAVGLFPPASLDDLTTPAALRTGDPVSSVPVMMQEYDDPQSVDVAVTVHNALPLLVRRSGSVTMWECEPGTAFESGTSTIAVDGVPLLNVSTSVPLWRDVVVGASGPDVRSLEEELVRLDYEATPDGTWSSNDLAALSDLATKVDVKVDGGVPRDLLVWLPRGSTRIDSCAATLGSDISAGDPVAEASPDIALSPVDSPSGSIPGPRDLELFGDPVPLSESGTLPDELDPDVVRAAPAFLEALAGDPDASRVILRGTTVLQTPVSVAAVPASAVLVVDGGAACVFSEAVAHAVTVVGSEFGSSFVLFDDDSAPTSVDLARPAEDAECA